MPYPRSSTVYGGLSEATKSYVAVCLVDNASVGKAFAGILALVSTLVCVVTPALSQHHMPWRFWTATDGLRESYSRSISLGATGRVWVRHGAAGGVSVLDGYSVTQVPEPRGAGIDIDWSRFAGIHEDRAGIAWTVENRALMRYDGARWSL